MKISLCIDKNYLTSIKEKTYLKLTKSHFKHCLIAYTSYSLNVNNKINALVNAALKVVMIKSLGQLLEKDIIFYQVQCQHALKR